MKAEVTPIENLRC